jgi:hypothetical protein
MLDESVYVRQIAISVSLLFMTFFSVVWFAAKIYRGNFNVWKETHGKNYTNGLKYFCLVVDSFSRM